MNSKSLKEMKLLRCNSGGENIKDILVKCDNIIYDINENRRRLLDISHNNNNNYNSVSSNNDNNNKHIHDNNDNINDSNNVNNDINTNDDNNNNNNEAMNKENEIKTIPFTFSIQYKNIKHMENVIYSTASTLLKKNNNDNNSNNNDNINLTELPDFSNDVELNQINKINELISWRQELMKNCINNISNNNNDNSND